MGHPSTKRLNFTKTSLETLPWPTIKKFEVYYDIQIPKLAIHVYPSGNKVFYLILKHNNRTEKLKVGAYSELFVENARKKAAEMLGTLAQGVNPQNARRVLRQEMTFGEACTWFTNHYSRSRKKHSSIEEDEGLFRRYLQDWSNRKLSSITRENISSKHIKIGKENGIYAANRMLALVSTIYNKALIGDKFDGKNPCIGIEKFKEKPRDRVFLPKERERFFGALEQYGEQTAKDCLMMVALTGQRKMNVMTMQWKDIKLDDRIWCIPETKTGRNVAVPLTTRALNLLERRKAEAKGKYVFPGKSKAGHMTRLEPVFHFCVKKAEIDNLRIHDLRRSLGTSISECGGNTFIVMKAMGHKTVKSASVYNHPGMNTIRHFFEEAEKAAFPESLTTVESTFS